MSDSLVGTWEVRRHGAGRLWWGASALFCSLWGPALAGGPVRQAVTLQARLAFEGQAASGLRVWYAAPAGDVNGDGYTDLLVVRATQLTPGPGYRAEVGLHLGGPAGPQTSATWSAISTEPWDWFAASVAGAGDLNGDGYDDVVIGAPGLVPQQPLSQAWVYLGTAGGLSAQPAWHVAGDDSRGSRVAAAGDVNRDGYDDLLLGAPAALTPGGRTGRVLLYYGGPAGPASTPGWSAEGESAQAGFGVALGHGDFDGDGWSDVVVGSPGWSVPAVRGVFTPYGRIYVYRGSPTGLPHSAQAYSPDDPGSEFGSAVATGDLNGDGRDDLLVGAYESSQGMPENGRVDAFFGTPGGIAAAPGWSMAADRALAHLGASLAAADVNRDGYDDVLAGAPWYGPVEFEGGGRALLYLGTPTGPSMQPAWSTEYDAPFDAVGYNVAAADFDGNGCADLVVDAFGYDQPSWPDAGRTQVHLFRAPHVPGDFNADDRSDLVLHHTTTGRHQVWLLDGARRLDVGKLTPTPGDPALRLSCVEDFDGDGDADLLFWNSASGAAEFWLLERFERVGDARPLVGPALPPTWQPVASADFDGDGRADLLWRQVSDGRLVAWKLHGTVFAGAFTPQPDRAVDNNWSVIAARDFDADGLSDLLWYNATSGRVALWLMGPGLVRRSGRFTDPPQAGDANWQVVAAADYGIGPAGLPATADIVWRHRDSGRLVVWHLDKGGRRTAGVFTDPPAPEEPQLWSVVGPR